MKVTILDIQPIDPPIGGGRIRLLGLYSGFQNGIDATYVGSYDWKGPGFRDHRLSPCLREIDVPLSDAHFSAHEELARDLGMGCIDSAFSMQAELSPGLIERARAEAEGAEVVIFSHPWLFRAVAPVLDASRQLIVYDSQNCEGYLRAVILKGNPDVAERVQKNVVRDECELCRAAHRILACSEEDKEKFVRLYGVDPHKVLIAPNGVFTTRITPCEDAQKRIKLREKLGIDRPAVCFMGSNYGPNADAARFVLHLAQRMPECQFLLIGGVGESVGKIDPEKYNGLIVTGFIDEEKKLEYLAACDLALNPMMSGSGTNIKMFDFMAAGMPIVTSEIGARGIPNSGGRVYELCEPTVGAFRAAIERLLADRERYQALRAGARREVTQRYSWENISRELGYRLNQAYRREVLGEKPFFSVVIPTYERHDLLTRLLDQLKRQTESDFEVVIVDQSEADYADLRRYADMDILYYKTDIRGAVKARNTGIRLCRGEVVAFIDDDCVPEKDWLKNAHTLLRRPSVVGVEGKIYADRYDTARYRVVSNQNFEGIGFMTANLFVLRDVLEDIGGFDEAFDNPHFREDTDLGWRARRLGKFPYAADVRVLHPSHRRTNQRESAEERNKFYVHDPLMLKKHGREFVSLMVAEGHYKEQIYWEYFEQGMARHDVDPALLKLIARDNRIDKSALPKSLFP